MYGVLISKVCWLLVGDFYPKFSMEKSLKTKEENIILSAFIKCDEWKSIALFVYIKLKKWSLSNF